MTRVRRGDVDVLASEDTVLELGDRVRVVAPVERLNDVSKALGDALRPLSEVNVTTFGLGIALGLLLGLLPIPLPGGASFKLGFAGGPLIVGLLLGRLWAHRAAGLATAPERQPDTAAARIAAVSGRCRHPIRLVICHHFCRGAGAGRLRGRGTDDLHGGQLVSVGGPPLAAHPLRAPQRTAGGLSDAARRAGLRRRAVAQ